MPWYYSFLCCYLFLGVSCTNLLYNVVTDPVCQIKKAMADCNWGVLHPAFITGKRTMGAALLQIGLATDSEDKVEVRKPRLCQFRSYASNDTEWLPVRCG